MSRQSNWHDGVTDWYISVQSNVVLRDKHRLIILTYAYAAMSCNSSLLILYAQISIRQPVVLLQLALILPLPQRLPATLDIAHAQLMDPKSCIAITKLQKRGASKSQACIKRVHVQRADAKRVSVVCNERAR